MSDEHRSFNSMMRDLYLPSLEDIALMSIGRHLIEQDDVKKIHYQHFMLKKHGHSLSENRASKIIEICCASVKIPEILQGKFLGVLHWMRNQYFDYISFVERELPVFSNFADRRDYFSHVMDSIIWNLNSTVNYQSSLKKFFSLLRDIKADDDLMFMFKIASRFCFDDEIKLIWPKLSRDSKEKLLKKRKVDSLSFLEQCDFERDNYYNFTFYWSCVMSGNETKFVQYASEYVKEKCSKYRNMLEDENFEGKASDFYFLFSLFEYKGVLAGVKYFFETASVYFKNAVVTCLKNWHYGYHCGFEEDAKILQFLLCQIEDDELVKKIFNEYYSVFLNLSVKYWPWNRFLCAFVNMCGDGIEELEFYDMINHLLECIQNQTTDLFILKNMWNKNLSRNIKESFCSFISKKSKKRDVENFWKNVTMEIMEMFLKDEKLREILTPYNNEGIYGLILAQRYDVINYWMDKCLGSYKAIIAVMEDYIVTRSVAIIKNFQRFPLSRVISFLEYCFKYEDDMDKEKIFEVKDQVVKQVGVATLVRNFKLRKWEELEKFMAWILKNRINYEDKWINLKKEALMEIFKTAEVKFGGEPDFEYFFNKFVVYGVSDIEKLNITISETNFNECKNCSEWLKEGDWASIEIFLKFLTEYGKNLLKIKKNILLYIFSDEENLLLNFACKSYYENIKKLLSWNSGADPDTMKKIWDINNKIIDKHGLESINDCIEKGSSGAFRNLMEFLFKDNKSENIEKIIFDLKIEIIENLLNDKLVLEKKENYLMMGKLLNWGRNDNNLKKEIWFAKKYFIEHFKNVLTAEVVPDLIFGKEDSFICVLFKDNTHENDFKKILLDLKEYLLKEIVDNDDHLLICQLFENFDEFNEFLNWNGFSEIGLKNFKELILAKKAGNCCLEWILNNKFTAIKHFLIFCIAKDSDYNTKMLKLKKSTLLNFCKDSKNWEKKKFELLDKFLLLHRIKGQKNCKEEVIDKYAAKSVCKVLHEGESAKVNEFLNWALKDEKSKEVVIRLKEKILKEVLNVKTAHVYWKKRRDYWNTEKAEFRDGLNQVLYEYRNPDLSIISSMKLDLIKIHFIAIVKKFLSVRKIYHLKKILAWAFDDEHLKCNEFLPRLKNYQKEMFDKLGKEYCVVMLRENDWEAAVEFLKPFFESPTDLKVAKALLWSFKKDCIQKILTNEISDERNDRYDRGKFWGCLNKFLLWGPTPSNIKNDINKLKENVKQEYGIDIVKKMFKGLSKNIYNEPKYFLRWLFGIKNSNSSMDLSDKALFDFKKEILENLLTLDFEDIQKENVFYNFLEEIFKFNSEHLFHVYQMKKKVVKVQGVKLCMDLICKNNVETMERFLKWVMGPLREDIQDFKISVTMKLAGNSTLAYNWETFKCFLDYDYRLNYEEDRVKYSELKNEVFKSFGIDICYNWILKKQWDFVRDFLKWSLEPLDNQKLNEFKNLLVEKYGSGFENILNFDNMMEID